MPYIATWHDRNLRRCNRSAEPTIKSGEIAGTPEVGRVVRVPAPQVPQYSNNGNRGASDVRARVAMGTADIHLVVKNV